jgi:hypothetical protein
VINEGARVEVAIDLSDRATTVVGTVRDNTDDEWLELGDVDWMSSEKTANRIQIPMRSVIYIAVLEDA